MKAVGAAVGSLSPEDPELPDDPDLLVPEDEDDEVLLVPDDEDDPDLLVPDDDDDVDPDLLPEIEEPPNEPLSELSDSEYSSPGILYHSFRYKLELSSIVIPVGCMKSVSSKNEPSR